VDKFTPEEQAAIDYHRSNLHTGNAMRHPDGSMTTFMGSVVGTDQGHMILPTYWHNEIRDVPQAMRFALKSGIKFPTYGTAEEALAAEKRLHDVMEKDLQEYKLKTQSQGDSNAAR